MTKIKAPKMDIADARTAGQAFEIYRQQHEPRHGDTGTFTDLDGIEMEWGCFDSGNSAYRFQFRAWIKETGDFTLIKYFI